MENVIGMAAVIAVTSWAIMWLGIINHKKKTAIIGQVVCVICIIVIFCMIAVMKANLHTYTP